MDRLLASARAAPPRPLSYVVVSANKLNQDNGYNRPIKKRRSVNKRIVMSITIGIPWRAGDA